MTKVHGRTVVCVELGRHRPKANQVASMEKARRAPEVVAHCRERGADGEGSPSFMKAEWLAASGDPKFWVRWGYIWINPKKYGDSELKLWPISPIWQLRV
jgi:hypothetical protein